MIFKPKILILTGYGLNCEKESQFAWEKAGGMVDFIHIFDLLKCNYNIFLKYDILMFMGGFSFGDHVGSGHVLAAKIKNNIFDWVIDFINIEKNLILGICNGFQILTKLGLLPNLEDNYTQSVALINNECGYFQNRWIKLKINPNSNCIFTKNIDYLELPIRNGEGRLFCECNILNKIKDYNYDCLHYINPLNNEVTMEFPYNPSFSMGGIAGLCSKNGRIFGLMPHPEAFIFKENHPLYFFDKNITQEGQGIKIFKNAINFIKNT